MSLSSHSPKTPRQVPNFLPVLSVSSWPNLRRQTRPLEDAVVWQRSLPEPVQNWLDQIPNEQLPSGRFCLAPTDISACIGQLFREAGLADHPALAWICQDAQRLAELVADIHSGSKLRLRLEPVFDNACRKFHVDNVVARLICTYRGPGTQLSMSAEEKDEIATLPTGAPVLLKGKQWPQGDEIALHHRSPPIEGTGLSRLVLVLEPVYEDDEFGTSYDRRFIPN